MKNEVTIKFETDEQAEAFMDWLDNSGEQEYFTVAEMLDDGQFVDQFSYDRKSMTITGKTL